MKIALISCTKLKQDHPCTAQEMYLPSELFKRASAYVKANYSRWFILSAKYGLLEPDDVIEPYNITLTNMSKSEIESWSRDVFEKLLKYNINDVDFYAGKQYRKYLIPLLEAHRIHCFVPLQSLGIGQQLHFYGAMLR